jgi:hypothetical protein
MNNEKALTGCGSNECRNQRTEERSQKYPEFLRSLLASLRSNFVRAALCSLLVATVAFGQVVFLDLPDQIEGSVGETIPVPILISGHVGLGVLSADITLRYRDAVISGTSYCQSGNAVPSGWMAYANPITDSLLIAMAGADPLTAGDTLVMLKFIRHSPDTTSIWFARCQLNEGAIPCSTGHSNVTCITEDRTTPQTQESGLRIQPNPTADRAVIRWSGFGIRNPNPDPRTPIPEEPLLTVLDPCGSVVRRIPTAAGSFEASWDGLNDQGRRVPAGVYFCRLQTTTSVTQQRLILLR